MPYYTEIPSNLITVGVDGGIVFVPNTNLLNAFEDSKPFSQYDVAAQQGPTTLSNGDGLSLVDGDGNSLTGPGSYIGSATVANAATSVGIPGVATISLTVNPISGHLMAGDDGTYYFLSATELDDAHLSVTASVTIAGRPISVTGPISGITSQLATAVAAVPIAGPIAAGLITASGNLLQTTANTAIVTINSNTNGTLPLSDDDVFCFVAGTLIETRHGLVAVEDLRLDDEILTRDNGYQPIRWIGSVKLSAATLARNPKLRPVRISPGSLGENMPSADLLVSPQHRVLVRSKIAVKMFGAIEVLVPAKQLLQLDGIDYAEDMAEVEYFHFLFDRHEVVMSNGAATESLFTGPQALKSVGQAARQEILTLFPQLADEAYAPEPVRAIPSGRLSRKLAMRHAAKDRALVS